MIRVIVLMALALGSSPAAAAADDRHCLALTLYWEARGESDAGMRAVGWVVLNRVRDERFPPSVCGVVFQGGETPPCQFSWWCDGKSDRPTDRDNWQRARRMAERLLDRPARDPTNGALFFHAKRISAPWRVRRERTAVVGNHVFYR